MKVGPNQDMRYNMRGLVWILDIIKPVQPQAYYSLSSSHISSRYDRADVDEYFRRVWILDRIKPAQPQAYYSLSSSHISSRYDRADVDEFFRSVAKVGNSIKSSSPPPSCHDGISLNVWILDRIKPAQAQAYYSLSSTHISSRYDRADGDEFFRRVCSQSRFGYSAESNQRNRKLTILCHRPA
ncbi:unnamed protein product [Orchesella dallaii]|uniref:Uncharacterized protein n=1 Tax=Orchesella dallaii TaxID=48710 RepID=A0ABP1REY5_9HEXA